MNRRFIYYALFLFIGLLSLINRDLTPVNELKYVSIALESIQNHHWFTFYNHGEIYADKPPIYFWLLIAALQLFGINGGIIVVGAISLIAALGICELMYRWTLTELTPAQQISAILVLLSSVLFIGASLILRMDILMAYCITLALYSYYQAKQRLENKQTVGRYPHVMLLAILLATLIKGPVGLMLPILVALIDLTWQKSLKNLRHIFPYRTVLLSIMVLALWLTAVYWEGGAQYLHALTLGQAEKRGINATVHAEPIYYYLQTAFTMLQPWSLLGLVALVGLIKQRHFLSPQQRFFSLVAFTGFIMLSLVSSKLEIYFLPLVPFVLYAALLQFPTWQQIKVARWGILPVCVLLTCMPIAVLIAHKAISKLPVESVDIYLVAIILCLTGLIAGYWSIKNQLTAAINSLALGVFVILLTAAIQIPKYNHLLGVKQLAQVAEQKATQQPIYQKQAPQKQYYTFQYASGMNLNVYLNQPVQPINSPQALLNLPKGSVVVSKRSAEQINKIFTQANSPLTSLTQVGKYEVFVR